MVALGELHQPVAGAAMGELCAPDLHDVRAMPTRERHRAVGRSRVDHEQLDRPVDLLGRDGGEDLAEECTAVEDRDRDSGRAHRNL